MPAMPLAHVSWAIADNEERKACDAFFIDVFGAETAFEMLVTPETKDMGLDREERLMMIGDTMVVPISPAGSGLSPDSPTGEMLRRSAGPMRWLGVALKVADLKAADKWFTKKGFKLHYDPGMETHYFLIGRGQAMGVRIEVLAQDLPGDPRRDAVWIPAKWRDEHPLGIEGLQAIGISTESVDDAGELFAEKLGWLEMEHRELDDIDADCAPFMMGDTVLEALESRTDRSALAKHAKTIKGIYCLTFKVKSAPAAAEYLRGKGLEIVGNVAERFAIRPDQCFGRMIYFTDKTPEGYPPLGSKVREPAKF
jgi:catechol 2,3-dioxygenase-like lactoylglutathione lyase family enzyme